MMLRLKSDVVCTMSVLLLISMGVQSENQVLIAVWVSSCERLSITTDQISVSEFMVAIGSAPSKNVVQPHCAHALSATRSV